MRRSGPGCRGAMRRSCRVTLSNLIIVPSQFACHPGSVSPCLLPRISGSRGSISQGILGLGTTARVFFSHINRVPEQPPHWTFLPDELIRIMVGVENPATAGSRALYRRWDLRYAPRYGRVFLPAGWVIESSQVGLTDGWLWPGVTIIRTAQLLRR